MSTLIDDLTQQLRRDEGERLTAYRDSLGFWTLGVGRLIDARRGGGISRAESAYLLGNDIGRVAGDLRETLPWITALDEARQGVLMNMAFQMGVRGLLGFRNTLGMVERGEYGRAAAGMLNSKWARQTPERAQRLAVQMRTGQWV